MAQLPPEACGKANWVFFPGHVGQTLCSEAETTLQSTDTPSLRPAGGEGRPQGAWLVALGAWHGCWEFLVGARCPTPQFKTWVTGEASLKGEAEMHSPHLRGPQDWAAGP